MPPVAIRRQLPRPCLAPWDAMLPTNAGRHCAACQKVVVDFSQQTDAELLAYFRRAQPGTTCGRFRAGQLGRPLVAPPPRCVAWLAGVLLTILGLSGCQQPPAPRPDVSTTDEVLAAADSTTTLSTDSVAVAADELLLGDVDELRDKQ